MRSLNVAFYCKSLDFCFQKQKLWPRKVENKNNVQSNIKSQVIKNSRDICALSSLYFSLLLQTCPYLNVFIKGRK